ncbi:MAG: winged helix-turn-helix domain-containing protein [Novosphingobium sp.]
MTTTVLITDPQPGLLTELRVRRPDWRLLDLAGPQPPETVDGNVWAFIDWICPQMSGLELCRRLRDATPTRRAHLTMVLESADMESRRRALQAGADDYLLGPLDADRLLDRVDGGPAEASVQPARQILRHGAIAVDCTAHQVRHDGDMIALRPNEFRLLVHFLEHPDQVFSRQALIEHLGKHALGIDERTVDVWIGRLRRSLIAAGAPDPLRTVRSLGYVLDSI